MKKRNHLKIQSQMSSLKVFIFLTIGVPLYTLVILVILSRGYQLPPEIFSWKIFAISAADITPPSTPQLLEVRGLLPSTRSTLANNILTWSPASDDVAVTNYTVYRNGIAYASVTGTNYTDMKVYYSTDYWYEVAAKDAAGNVSYKSPKRHMTGIWGDILDATNNRYIRGAVVTVTGPVASTATANYAGGYLLNLKPGTFAATYSAPGYLTQSFVINVTDNQMTSRNVFLVKAK